MHRHSVQNDAIEPVVDKDGIKVMSLNFLMEDENQPVVWRGPIVANAVKQFWTDVVWGGAGLSVHRYASGELVMSR